MYANYHTHTVRCHHAVGTEREYIEKAIQEGVTELGFSDHVPYPFSTGYQSGIRMSTEETREYVETLQALREEYQDRIRIYIGYEVEYYPKEFDGLLKHLGQFGYDYLIMGQHYLDNEYDGAYSGHATEDKEKLTKYVDQVLEGLATGHFLYLAHPDLIRYEGDADVYEQEMTRLCRGAKALSIPLEINLLGLETGRHYPSETFWRIAAQEGNQVIIGCDAHAPKDVADARALEHGYAFAESFGLQPIDRLNIGNKF